MGGQLAAAVGIFLAVAATAHLEEQHQHLILHTRKIHQLAARHGTIPGAHHWPAYSSVWSNLAAVCRHLSCGGSDYASGGTTSAPRPWNTRKIHQLAARHGTIPGAHHWPLIKTLVSSPLVFQRRYLNCAYTRKARSGYLGRPPDWFGGHWHQHSEHQQAPEEKPMMIWPET